MSGVTPKSDAQKSKNTDFSVVPFSDILTTEGSILESVHSDGVKYSSANYRRAAGASYVVAVGMCGIVLVALMSSFKDLAKQVDRTSIQLPGVFISRGLGAGLGALLSSKLYLVIPGKVLVSIALFLLAGCVLSMALISRETMLVLNFGAVGFLTAVITAGSQIMTHRLHGSAAGPWLGANTIAFGVSGAFSPLIGFLTGSLVVEYSILASMAVCIAFFLVVMPEPQKQVGLLFEDHPEVLPVRIPGGILRPKRFYEDHKIDIHIAGMMFWLMGGRISATAFLRQFADDTKVASANAASLLIVLLWLAITLGRLAGLRDQQSVNLNLSRLYRHQTFTIAVGGMMAFLLLVSYTQDAMLWITVILYGFFNGPTLGYCYDLSTRVSPNPTTSTAVAMFGLTAGSSIVPVFASGLWELSGFAGFLPLILVFSHVVPLLLLINVAKLHPAEDYRLKRSLSLDPASASVITPIFGPSSDLSLDRANNGPAGGHQDPTLEDEEQQGVEIVSPRDGVLPADQ